MSTHICLNQFGYTYGKISVAVTSKMTFSFDHIMLYVALQVLVQSLTVPLSGRVSTHFIVDDTIGLNTVVSVIHEGMTPKFKVKVTGPHGETFSSGDVTITQIASYALDLL